jgi:hypothetical protein
VGVISVNCCGANQLVGVVEVCCSMGRTAAPHVLGVVQDRASYPHGSSLPTPIALLIRENTAPCAANRSSMVQNCMDARQIGPRIRIQWSTSMLFRGNAAIWPDIHWHDTVGTLAPRMVLSSTYHLVLWVINAIARWITIPVNLQKKDFF